LMRSHPDRDDLADRDQPFLLSLYCERMAETAFRRAAR